jgi:DNA-binding IclR family transcriptional regulator
MTVAQSTSRSLALPAEVDSPRAKLVYLYLDTNGGSTVADLCSELDVPKLTLFSVLKTLRSRELVECEDGRYRITR